MLRYLKSQSVYEVLFVKQKSKSALQLTTILQIYSSYALAYQNCAAGLEA